MTYGNLTALYGQNWVFWDTEMERYFWEKDEYSPNAFLYVEQLVEVKTVVPSLLLSSERNSL